MAEGFIFPISLSIIYIWQSCRYKDLVCMCAFVCVLCYILGFQSDQTPLAGQQTLLLLSLLFLKKIKIRKAYFSGKN